jgi:hypothetical protein
MTRIKTQDFLSWVIGTKILATGDFSVTLSQSPLYTKGFLMLEPTNPSQRESVYFHDRIWNVVYVKAENRSSPKLHSIGTEYQMTNSAELINYLSDNTNTFGYVEKTGWLTISVWGWYVLAWTWQVIVPDTPLTLPAQQTNYIYLTATNTIAYDINLSVANEWMIIATVITWATSVAEIVQQQPTIAMSKQGAQFISTIQLTNPTEWEIMLFNWINWINSEVPPEEWTTFAW